MSRERIASDLYTLATRNTTAPGWATLPDHRRFKWRFMADYVLALVYGERAA